MASKSPPKAMSRTGEIPFKTIWFPSSMLLGHADPCLARPDVDFDHVGIAFSFSPGCFALLARVIVITSLVLYSKIYLASIQVKHKITSDAKPVAASYRSQVLIILSFINEIPNLQERESPTNIVLISQTEKKQGEGPDWKKKKQYLIVLTYLAYTSQDLDNIVTQMRHSGPNQSNQGQTKPLADQG